MNIDYLALISIALLSSFGHCYAMCGGLNLAFLSLNAKASPLLSSLIYHSFRILAYMFLGLIFGFFGNILNTFSQSLVFFLAGSFMIILGVALFMRGGFLAFFESNVFFTKCTQKFLRKLHFKGYKNAMLLGFLNGFIPCGLVYFYLALALSQKSSLKALLIMFVFGLCTLPALLFFLQFFKILKQKYALIYSYLAYGLIIIYGFYYLYLALLFSKPS